MKADSLIDLMRLENTPRLEKPETSNMAPIYVCANQHGIRKGDVCGKIFWSGRPEICPQCGKHYPPA